MKQKKLYMKTNNTRFLVMLQMGSCQNKKNNKPGTKTQAITAINERMYSIKRPFKKG